MIARSLTYDNISAVLLFAHNPEPVYKTASTGQHNPSKAANVKRTTDSRKTKRARVSVYTGLDTSVCSKLTVQYCTKNICWHCLTSMSQTIASKLVEGKKKCNFKTPALGSHNCCKVWKRTAKSTPRLALHFSRTSKVSASLHLS